jgi:hypothetical protein
VLLELPEAQRRGDAEAGALVNSFTTEGTENTVGEGVRIPRFLSPAAGGGEV